jgi:hypothetical protein
VHELRWRQDAGWLLDDLSVPTKYRCTIWYGPGIDIVGVGVEFRTKCWINRSGKFTQRDQNFETAANLYLLRLLTVLARVRAVAF